MSGRFVLKDIFFKKFYLERPSQVPDDVKINVSIAGQIVENALNSNYLEIHLGIRSEDESLVKIEIDAVSMFDGIDEGTELPDIKDFVESQGLPVTFTLIRQQVLVLTGQMGMRQIKLNPPLQYTLQSREELESET